MVLSGEGGQGLLQYEWRKESGKDCPGVQERVSGRRVRGRKEEIVYGSSAEGRTGGTEGRESGHGHLHL